MILINLLPSRKTKAERFWSKVDKNGPPHPYTVALGQCWMWTAARGRKDGYGCFDKAHAHRAAFELAVGPLQPGVHVLHSCDNRACVNPAHLRAGTNAENVRDKVMRGRVRSAVGADNPCAKLSEGQVTELRARRAAGATLRELSEAFGVSVPVVHKAAHGVGYRNVASPPAAKTGFPQGERHHNSKLTAEQVLEIRARSAAGEPQARLMADYHVSQGTISGIVTRRTWGHL